MIASHQTANVLIAGYSAGGIRIVTVPLSFIDPLKAILTADILIASYIGAWNRNCLQ